VGNHESSVDEKNVRFYTAETLVQRIQEGTIMEVVIVGMSPSKRARLGMDHPQKRKQYSRQ
jgi:hypothetical protein